MTGVDAGQTSRWVPPLIYSLLLLIGTFMGAGGAALAIDDTLSRAAVGHDPVGEPANLTRMLGYRFFQVVNDLGYPTRDSRDMKPNAFEIGYTSKYGSWVYLAIRDSVAVSSTRRNGR